MAQPATVARTQAYLRDSVFRLPRDGAVLPVNRGADMAQAGAIQHFTDASLFDSLTGLPNRTYIAGRVQQLLKTWHSARISVLLIKLNGISKINQVSGYDLGDCVLRSVAGRLARS